MSETRGWGRRKSVVDQEVKSLIELNQRGDWRTKVPGWSGAAAGRAKSGPGRPRESHCDEITKTWSAPAEGIELVKRREGAIPDQVGRDEVRWRLDVATS